MSAIVLHISHFTFIFLQLAKLKWITRLHLTTANKVALSDRWCTFKCALVIALFNLSSWLKQTSADLILTAQWVYPNAQFCLKMWPLFDYTNTREQVKKGTKPRHIIYVLWYAMKIEQCTNNGIHCAQLAITQNQKRNLILAHQKHKKTIVSSWYYKSSLD